MKKKIKDLIWYEKYRGTKLDHLILPKNIRKNMDKYVKDKEIPHLLFHGPVGSGKTTLALILIKLVASSKLILNASSEDRGIATVKKRVRQFASSQRIDKDKLNIVFFDEADGLTPDAQLALKNTIETYQSNCRFIFTANDMDKVTDAIYSRCTMFEFTSMPKEYFLKSLYRILEKENIKFKERDVKKVVERYGTDVRTILNNLQVASVSGRFKVKDILDMFDTKEIESLIKSGNILKIREAWGTQIDFTWFYRFLFNDFLANEDLESDQRVEVALVIAEYMWKNKTVADKEINATACCLEIMTALEIDPVF